MLRPDDDACFCTNSPILAPGERADLTWLFDAPADGVEHVTVMVPFFGTIPGLPVIDGQGPLRLQIDDRPVEGLPDPGEHTHRLLASIEEIEDDIVTRVIETGGDTTDVALASDVLFDFDSDELRPEADPLIDDLVALLEDAGELPCDVIVEGHTDNQGSADYNLDLSERRARTVVAAFEERLERDDLDLKVVARGQDDPVAGNTDEEGRQRNRRVTARIPVEH